MFTRDFAFSISFLSFYVPLQASYKLLVLLINKCASKSTQQDNDEDISPPNYSTISFLFFN